MVPLHFHFTFEATEAQREMKKLMKPDLYISSKTGPMLKQNEAEYVFPFLFIYICICVTVQGAFVFYFLFILTTPHGMCDLSSQTRNWTCAPCIGSRVLTTRPHGKSSIFVYFIPTLLIMLFEACRGLKYLCQLRKKPLGIWKGNAKQRIVF